ncbi:MAG TPA: PLDc N-terminal domain-containing protein [Actinomycetota bacterium]|nr:PLDc N-terminal domain-containing protein [Actinomycetota bacterium]
MVAAVLGMLAAKKVEVPWAALAPLLVLGLGFLIYCWYDIAKSPSVRYLPKWVWALIAALSVPLGGILYLLVGRER